MTEQHPGIAPAPPTPEGVTLELPTPEEMEAMEVPAREISHEWSMVSGAVLRELDNPDVQAALTRFTATPVSEELPKAMLEALPSTPLLDRVRAGNEKLDDFVSLPAVEDSRLVPDLPTAAPVRRGDRISHGEYIQVRDRYRFARDVKLLSLGAELQGLGEDHPAPDEDGTVTLPSGIRMVSAPDLGEEGAALLDPTKWEGREQLKDRVYKIEVSGKPYILKEEKTDRHTDTLVRGHEPGLSPAEEFKVGHDLIRKTPDEHNGVKVEFERPLGHVEYPDGFKFGVFDYKEGLVAEEDNSRQTLTNAILNNPDKFKEEYEAAAKAVEEEGYKDIHAAELAPGMNPQGWGGMILKLAGVPKRRLKNARLSFEDFAMAKAAQMHISGVNGLLEARYMAGYRDPDSGGTMFAVDTENATLSVIGLDYERYSKIPNHAPSTERIATAMADRHYDRHVNSDDGHLEHATAIQRAATVALLERDDPRWKGEQP